MLPDTDGDPTLTATFPRVAVTYWTTRVVEEYVMGRKRTVGGKAWVLDGNGEERGGGRFLMEVSAGGKIGKEVGGDVEEVMMNRHNA